MWLLIYFLLKIVEIVLLPLPAFFFHINKHTLNKVVCWSRISPWLHKMFLKPYFRDLEIRILFLFSRYRSSMIFFFSLCNLLEILVIKGLVVVVVSRYITRFLISKIASVINSVDRMGDGQKHNEPTSDNNVCFQKKKARKKK